MRTVGEAIQDGDDHSRNAGVCAGAEYPLCKRPAVDSNEAIVFLVRRYGFFALTNGFGSKMMHVVSCMVAWVK